MRIQKSEPVQLVAKTHGYFPASFRWRSRRFDVVAVEKCWTVSGHPVRRLFAVRCQAGRFVLQQSVEGDHWQVTRWPLTLWLPRIRRSDPPRFPLPRHQRRPVARARVQQVPSSGQLAASGGTLRPGMSLDAPRVPVFSPQSEALVPVRVKVKATEPRRDQWTGNLQRS